jgi:DNA (cytosine-5)-methyltransferase 1
MGWPTVFQCEKDTFCQSILRHHWPDAHLHDDIFTFDARPFAGQIDLLTGGFPCQPFSCFSRNKKGKADPRYLWPEMLRVIDECRPRYIVGENVRGFVPHLGGAVLDLAKKGYTADALLIPAEAVGAPHIRERCWILAHADHDRRKPLVSQAAPDRTLPATRSGGRRGVPMWDDPAPAATGFCGVADGIPTRPYRVRALGNAIVPQVAYRIFRALETWGGVNGSRAGQPEATAPALTLSI